MKQKLLTITLLLFFFQSYSQTAPEFEWSQNIKNINVGGNFDVQKVLMDEEDLPFFIGNFSNTANFNYTSDGSLDYFESANHPNATFISRADENDQIIWVKQISGEGLFVVKDAVINGNFIYLAGELTGIVDFNPSNGINNLESTGQRSVVIAKYDLNGFYVDSRLIGGADADIEVNAVKSKDNNLVIVGSFNGSVDFDPSNSSNIITSLDVDGYISLFTNNLSLVWASNEGDIFNDNIYDSALKTNPINGSLESIYVSGLSQVDYSDEIFECSLNAMQFVIQTDSYPEEVYWQVLDVNGNVVAYAGEPEGAVLTYGNYTGLANTEIIEEFCLPQGDYVFEIYDSYGDGGNSFSLTQIQSGITLFTNAGDYADYINYNFSLGEEDEFYTSQPDPTFDLFVNEYSITDGELINNIIIDEIASYDLSYDWNPENFGLGFDLNSNLHYTDTDGLFLTTPWVKASPENFIFTNRWGYKDNYSGMGLGVFNIKNEQDFSIEELNDQIPLGATQNEYYLVFDDGSQHLMKTMAYDVNDQHSFIFANVENQRYQIFAEGVYWSDTDGNGILESYSDTLDDNYWLDIPMQGNLSFKFDYNPISVDIQYASNLFVDKFYSSAPLNISTGYNIIQASNDFISDFFNKINSVMDSENNIYIATNSYIWSGGNYISDSYSQFYGIDINEPFDDENHASNIVRYSTTYPINEIGQTNTGMPLYSGGIHPDRFTFVKHNSDQLIVNEGDTDYIFSFGKKQFNNNPWDLNPYDQYDDLTATLYDNTLMSRYFGSTSDIQYDGTYVTGGKLPLHYGTGIHNEIDSQGNVYLIAHNMTEADVDGDGLADLNMNLTGKNVYISKSNSSNENIWLNSIVAANGEFGDAYVSSAKIDGDDNLILVGTFAGSVDFDMNENQEYILTSDVNEQGYVQYNFYVAKYNQVGELLWVKVILPEMYYNAKNRINIDSMNNIYFSGAISSDENATSIDVDSSNDNAFYLNFPIASEQFNYIAKLDSNGNFVFVKLIDPVFNGSNRHAISVNHDKLLYSFTPIWCGEGCEDQFEADLNYGYDPVSLDVTNKEIMVEYDLSGNYQTHFIIKEYNENSLIVAGSPMIDSFGNIYSKSWNQFEGLTSIMKFNPQGSITWGKNIPGTRETFYKMQYHEPTNSFFQRFFDYLEDQPDFSEFEGGYSIDNDNLSSSGLGTILLIIDADDASVKQLKNFENAIYLNYTVTDEKLLLATSYINEIGLVFENNEYSDFTEIEDVAENIIAQYDLSGWQLDIDESIFENNITVYPNPTQNILNVKFNDFEKLEVYNIMGQLILRSDSETINVSDFENGVYVVKIYGKDGGSYSSKFIKN